MNDYGEFIFEIKNGGDFIRINAIGLLLPNADLTWDRNWIDTNIEVNVSPFRGKYRASLMTVDFEKFKQELKRIYKDLNGVTMFDSLEGDIEIKINGDGLGHFTASCIARDTTTPDGSQLEFSLTFDQTQIPGLINQLDEITKQFPIIGDEFRIRNE
jgi:hypothetical protein